MAQGTFSLFPNYSQGENRVTYAMLAVFERIALPLLREILAAAAGDSALTMVRFQSQPKLQLGTGVPDAQIAGSFNYLFEVKRDTDQVDANEVSKLEGYLREFSNSADERRLFVVTPDAVVPSALSGVKDARLSWVGFGILSATIDQVLAEDTEGVADRDRFLLRELQALFRSDGLLGTNDVVIVAARIAYSEYLAHSAYMCQAASKRSFQPSIKRIGFYADGEIKPEIPLIQRHWGDVPFTHEEVGRLRASGGEMELRLADLIHRYITEPGSNRPEGSVEQVFLLAPPDAPSTRVLSEPVKNTTRTVTGKPWAWTLGQRYTRLEHLERGPTTTGELDQMAIEPA